MTERDTSVDPVEDVPVCPRCFRENDATAAECEHCGAPLSGVGLTLPLEAAHAEGGGLGGLAHLQRPSKTLVVGAWMLLGPFVVGPFAAAMFALTDPVMRWIYAAFGLFFGVVFAFVLVRLTSNYAHSRGLPEAADDDVEPDGPVPPTLPA